MNVLLVSPVDALVFDYVAFGIFTVANNLWTWVAVLTAAVSFWRFKAAGVGGSVKLEKEIPGCIDRNGKDERVLETTAFKCSGSESEAASTSGPTLLSIGQSSVLEDNGVTKGKFVVYYREEDCVENGDECYGDGDETAFDDEHGGCGGEWWPERLLRMRKEELGWYSYQDLTVINGNVVKLWDESVRKEKKGQYSSGWVVW